MTDPAGQESHKYSEGIDGSHQKLQNDELQEASVNGIENGKIVFTPEDNREHVMRDLQKSINTFASITAPWQKQDKPRTQRCSACGALYEDDVWSIQFRPLRGEAKDEFEMLLAWPRPATPAAKQASEECSCRELADRAEVVMLVDDPLSSENGPARDIDTSRHAGQAWILHVRTSPWTSGVPDKDRIVEWTANALGERCSIPGWDMLLEPSTGKYVPMSDRRAEYSMALISLRCEAKLLVFRAKDEEWGSTVEEKLSKIVTVLNFLIESVRKEPMSDTQVRLHIKPLMQEMANSVMTARWLRSDVNVEVRTQEQAALSLFGAHVREAGLLYCRLHGRPTETQSILHDMSTYVYITLRELMRVQETDQTGVPGLL